MAEKTKRNIGVIVLGVFSQILIVSLWIFNTNSFIEEKNIFTNIIWVYLLVSFLSWLNVSDICSKKRIVYLDFVMQLSVFALMNILKWMDANNRGENLIIGAVAVILIGIEIVLHVQLPVRVEQEEPFTEKLQERQIASYLREKLFLAFGVIKEKKPCIEDLRIIISVWNAFTFLMIILAYCFKFIIDIVNINSDKYYFPAGYIFIYIIFLIVFVIFELKRNNLLGYSFAKSVFIILSGVLGVYLFVFRQFGDVNMRVIILAVYLMSPFLVDFRNVIHKYGI